MGQLWVTRNKVGEWAGISENRRSAIMQRVQEALAVAEKTYQGPMKALTCAITSDPVITNDALTPGMSALVIKRNNAGVISYYVEFFDFKSIKEWSIRNNVHPLSKEEFELTDIVPL